MWWDKELSFIQNMFVGVFSGSAFSGVIDTLGESLLGTGSAYSDVTKFSIAVYNNVMVPVAVSLLIIYFVVALIEKSTNEQFTYEQLFLLLAKMVIGIFLINKGFEILLKLEEAALDIFNLLKTEASGQGLGVDIKNAGEVPDAIKDLFKEMTGVKWPADGKELSFIKSIQAFLSAGIPVLLAWLAQLIIVLVLHTICFLRVMEIYVRSMFTPIALSDIFYNGLNSTGFRFLKNFFATFLQVVVIYGSMLIYIVMLRAITGIGGDAELNFAEIALNPFFFIIKNLALSFAMLGLALKSQSLAKEFLGSN